jgi:signal transduction histidine kinase
MQKTKRRQKPALRKSRPAVRLSRFIQENIEAILAEWDDFARTMGPPADTMSSGDLRDHAREILHSIIQDMQTEQSEEQREAKSKSKATASPDKLDISSGEHDQMRQRVGFDLCQLGAEYRALRVCVLRLWARTVEVADAAILEDVMRFNESMDRSLAAALVTYSASVANSRDTFLAVLGHDLRNPLDALNSCVKLFSMSKDEAQQQRAVRVARASILSIKTMISDLLEYTRSRLGKGIEVCPQACDLAVLCREVFEEISLAHPKRAFEAQIPAHVTADFDAPRMRQVLTNLLANAVQHGDAAFPLLLVVAHDRSGSVTLTVRNRGVPIPPESMQVIFNPLVQIETSPTRWHDRPSTSLGLGLYIANEIVTRHGGRLQVTSSAADGTAFMVRLQAPAPV